MSSITQSQHSVNEETAWRDLTARDDYFHWLDTVPQDEGEFFDLINDNIDEIEGGELTAFYACQSPAFIDFLKTADCQACQLKLGIIIEAAGRIHRWQGGE